MLCALGQSSLIASIPVVEEVRCPVGGKLFKFVTISAYTTVGRRPDGKPYGFTRFPLAMPECPDNRLILFDKFSDSEISKLEVLIKSADFKSLIKSETPYFRAYWLAKQLGRNAAQTHNLLIQAIWETAQKPVQDGSENSMAATIFLANAHRELREFTSAKALLTSIVFLIEPKPDKREQWPQEEWQPLRNYLERFMKVVERGDSSLEPLDLLPERIAAEKCWHYGENYSDFSKAFCSQPNILKITERFSRENQAELEAAADAAFNAAEQAVSAAANATEAAANASAAKDTPLPQ